MAEGLKLYNTLTRSKVDFTPIDPKNVRMYVCGPTVYDFAHIGNARPVIVFDVLYRLLRHIYGENHVTYARNITDVDDKINARALRDFPDLPLNEAIAKVTQKTADQFHADVAALGNLPPTIEPRATDNIQQMIDIIKTLIAKGHAYVAEGEVLFDTRSMAAYGQLSKRNLDEQQAGARIAVEAHKKHPGDFVLWKLSSHNEPGWESPWGRGRPGWHIECSAMSKRYLGEVFDIHGGGLDLIFPHHENEIAQSCCANDTSVMANVWMHNGFVQVEGRKMSKSDGNFLTIDKLLRSDSFGGRPWHGGVFRFAMLKTHYRQPIDWTLDKLQQSRNEIFSFIASCNAGLIISQINAKRSLGKATEQDADFIKALCDDLNTPLALSILFGLRENAKSDSNAAEKMFLALEFLGILDLSKWALYDSVYLHDTNIKGQLLGHDDLDRVERLRVALTNGDEKQAKKIKGEIESWGVQVNAKRNGEISLELKNGETNDLSAAIDALVEMRLEMLKTKNFAEADKIRDDLLAKGIQLKDGKDKDTGERVTTWEVKR
ncbi:cysteine--tRNA ligase [Agrobacterium vitis]|uniref:Cysteine--tRNA ligase n=1 Tax=Agrobacterium vitis TaxID=373 RepID=A0ABD6HAI2_AGRVI|nr:cysteine--tRNA ligase [Agrobacterium vitis]MUP11047.1 cysteine--tRNA ligase [Agrobacterium vitis]